MAYCAVNLADKFNKFQEHWSPKVIAEMNDYQFKLVKFQGEFVWHHHADTDETFLVISGSMVIDFPDGSVTLQEGEMFVVPKGVEHKPNAVDECMAMVIEPKGVVNTGNVGGERTVENDIWI